MSDIDYDELAAAGDDARKRKRELAMFPPRESPPTPGGELREHITDIRQLAEEMALTAEGVPGMNLALSKARIARVCRAFLALSERVPSKLAQVLAEARSSETYRQEAAELSSHDKRDEYTGYAVVMDDPNSAPEGFWWVGAWHAKDIADEIAKKHGKAAHVVPISSFTQSASSAMPWSPEETARRFHAAYEYFAPKFGYQTRPESAKPWAEVPEANKALMIAVVRNVLIEQASGQCKDFDGAKS